MSWAPGMSICSFEALSMKTRSPLYLLARRSKRSIINSDPSQYPWRCHVVCPQINCFWRHAGQIKGLTRKWIFLETKNLLESCLPYLYTFSKFASSSIIRGFVPVSSSDGVSTKPFLTILISYNISSLHLSLPQDDRTNLCTWMARIIRIVRVAGVTKNHILGSQTEKTP